MFYLWYRLHDQVFGGTQIPWNERIKFVARSLDGNPMTVVCRKFGITRKAGYEIFNRYKEIGLEGLQNQSR